MLRSKEAITIGVFDINGTIHTDESGISEQVRLGFESLHRQDISTTVITGRGINRAEDLLGEDWQSIVSPGMPISVENGSRLLSPDRTNIRHHPLSKDETDYAIDEVLSAEEKIKYLAYYPRNPLSGAVLRASGLDAVATFTEQHGAPGTYTDEKLAEFAKRLRADKASMIIVGASPEKVEGSFSEANVVANGVEVNILGAGVDKSRGVTDISEATGTPMDEILVAGNDHNDTGMLMLPVGKKLFVDGVVELDFDHSVETFPDPEALGAGLQGSESFLVK